MQGNVAHTDIAVTMPELSGALAFLGTQPAPRQIAAWVPSDAWSVAACSMDLPGGWAAFKATLAPLIGDAAAQQFDAMEQAFPSFAAGLTFDQFLAALGKNVWVVSLPVPADAPADTSRTGFVIDLADSAALSRLLPLFSMIGQKAQVAFVTEQGAQGVRITPSAEAGDTLPQMALFIDQQHLVFGLGDRVAEELLAAIRRGDQGAQSRPIFQDALAHVPQDGASFWQITDNAASAEHVADVMRDALTTIANMPFGPSQDSGAGVSLKEALGRLAEVMPTGDEIRATVAGPSTLAMWHADGALRLRALQASTMAP
jgi:hypothetical protein